MGGLSGANGWAWYVPARSSLDFGNCLVQTAGKGPGLPSTWVRSTMRCLSSTSESIQSSLSALRSKHVSSSIYKDKLTRDHWVNAAREVHFWVGRIWHQHVRTLTWSHPLNSDMSSLVSPSIGGGTLQEVQPGPRAPLGVGLGFW